MVHTIQTVFLIAVPIAVVAFALSWLLPEVELRKTVRTADPGKELGMHESRSSLEEIQLALERLACVRTGPSSTPHSRPVRAWSSSPIVLVALPLRRPPGLHVAEQSRRG